MSYFYLTPVEGNISLHILEECVHQRWLYFHKLFDGQSIEYCEYVVEGSAYDNIGHFMLNFLSMTSKENNLIEWVKKGEEELFFRRINKVSANDLRILCKTILRTTKSIHIDESSQSYLNILKVICRKMVVKHIAEHLCNNHCNNCNTYNVDCHFSLCLPLIAQRKVELNGGEARVPCCEWKHFLKYLFKSHLNWKHKQVNQLNASNMDPRWRDIIVKLTQNFPNATNGKKIIQHIEIDSKSEIFPLCTKNMHKTLREKHRLSHDDRFRYSLFLKDIGMPLQQSIYFWQKEYSKSSVDSSTCCHNWSKDEKKYIYGIRHLYGLEGSRKSYQMPNCKRIQSQITTQGGCPYKHFDKEFLAKLLDFNVASNEQWNEILNKISVKDYTGACNIHKNAIILSMGESHTNISSTKLDELQNPVDFYHFINSYNKKL